MSKNITNFSRAMFILAGTFAWAVVCPATRAQLPQRAGAARMAPVRTAGDHHAGHDHDHDHGHAEDPIMSHPPHGGQVESTGGFRFEVVYQPRQTRIYLYEPGGRALSTQGVQGELVMQVRGNSNVFRFPIRQAPRTAGPDKQDYLVVDADVSRVRDGDMQVTFDLANLPHRSERQARFTQTFALLRSRVAVTVAPLTRADRPHIAAQKTCPVMNTKLGDHGKPIKLLVGNRPLYVCCKGCINKVKKNPDRYLAKLSPSQRGRP